MDCAAPQGTSGSDAELPTIPKRYLMVATIPCHIDHQGRRWTDPLWHKDLVEHLRYLPHFVLASPTKHGPAPQGSVCLTDDPLFGSVTYVDLPHSQSVLRGLWHLPRVLARLWSAIGNCDVVHAGVAGWPIPMGWPATVLSVLRRRFLVMYVESAFWRAPAGAGFRRRLRARVSEAVNRWCVNRADLPLFTQREYVKELLTRHPERGHVIQASWIDEAVMMDTAAAAEAWRAKRATEPRALRMLFAGRLVEEKGVRILMEAVRRLERRGTPVELDVLGEGSLREEVEQAAHGLNGRARIRLLGTIEYGPRFFELLRGYDVLVLPSISDEQPRIVYDAFSQAVPILGSATAGIRECVTDGVTGILCAAGDPEALAAAAAWCASHRDELERRGVNALGSIASATHRQMHRRRWKLLWECLDIGMGTPRKRTTTSG